MTGTVPALSIVFMIITCAISFGVPIALFIYLRLVKKADIYPFFAGCVSFQRTFRGGVSGAL